MKILLADDDKLIRFTLKSMLTDILDSDCIIIEAVNGRELTTRCMDSEPDIAFVDINMPYLDGISAISICKESSPNTEFIVLTGYSEFEYAKKCIALGVSDYILKPIEFEYLKSTIEKLSVKLLNNKAMDNSHFQSDVINAFNMLSKAEIIDKELPILNELSEEIFAFTFFIDCIDEHDVYSNAFQQVLLKVKELGLQLLCRNQFYAIVYSSEGLLRVIFKANKNQKSYIVRKVEKICADISSNNVYIYSIYTFSNSFHKIYQDCDLIEKYGFVRIIEKPGAVKDFQYIDLRCELTDFCQKLSLLITAFIEADEIQYKNNVNDIYRNHKTININLSRLSDYIKVTTKNIVNDANFKDFCKSLIDISQFMYRSIKFEGNNKIEAIQAFVDKSYMNDISINSLADKFNLTPNYISKIFHDKTGIKFTDYLTNLRITNSKRLLISNYDTPIKDIAIMVGYYSPRHFSSIFKKLTHFYPTEYRKNHIKE